MRIFSGFPMAQQRRQPETHQPVLVRAADDSLAARIIEAQDNERRKISRELHDSVGQSLVVAIMSIDGFMRENSIANITKLDEARRALDSALSEIRTLSHLLHPPDLELLGLGPSLAWLAEGFQQRAGIQAKLEAPQELPSFSSTVATTIFRIAQEALTNVHRHAEAANVVIRASVTPTEFQLEVSDDGKGFADLEACRQGVGILGMQERLAELGGVLRVESGRNAGSSVFATVPLEEIQRPTPEPSQASPHEGVGRVLVVDDHPAMRQGVRGILGVCPDLEVCGEASTVDEAVNLIAEVRPDIVLLDLQLGREDGWAVVRKLRLMNSPAKIIIFSFFDAKYIGPAARNAGCAGFVSKGESSEELIKAIRTVIGGGDFLHLARSAGHRHSEPS